MVILICFDILQLPYTTISNSEKMAHPFAHAGLFNDYLLFEYEHILVLVLNMSFFLSKSKSK